MSAKRANVFSQGRPENPYEDRDGPPDPPQRATAAQLAARKIKSVKPRRAGGASSGMSQSANFGGAFASPALSENGANAFAGFGGETATGNNVFGGAATNSFPPAQPAAPSNNFSNSSFPAFGANTQSTGFNPQPPSSNGFNFTAGGSSGNNPFGASAPAPATNGNASAPTFGAGSSLFSPQPPSNPFGGLTQKPTSSAPSSNMFGSTSGASQSSNMFGTTSAAPNVASTPMPASTPFTFGSATPSAPSVSTPATSGMFSGFGASTQTAPPATSSTFSGFGASTQTAPPPQNNLFSFGSNTPQKDKSSQPTEGGNMFGSIGTSAQESTGFAATAPAPASNLFNFNPSTPKSEVPASTLLSSAATANSSTSAPAPPSNLFNFNPTATKTSASTPISFGTSSAATTNTSTPAPAPTGNPFANLAPAAASTNAKPSLFAPSSTSQSQEKAPTTSNNLFSGLKSMEQNEPVSADSPKANPFASLSKPASTPVAAPATASGGFNFMGAAQSKDSSSAPKFSLSNTFSTPQPSKMKAADAEKPAFNTVQSKPGTGLFAQPFTSKGDTAIINPDAFKPKTTFPSFTSTQKPSAEAPKGPEAIPTESNPFNQQSAPASNRPSMFSAFKQTPTASPAPSMPAFTGAQAGTSKATELPKVPKVHVPKGWAQPGSVAAQGAHGIYQHIADLTAQLQALNDRYRQQLSTLSSTADWSAVSLWHYQHASDIKKKIDNAKKQRAASNGVTGTESSLSTKRKVNEQSPENRDMSFKRARGGEVPATPTPQSFAATGSVQPTATSTSNMFAKAINGTKSSPAPSAGSSLFAPKTVKENTVESPKPSAASSGFTPLFAASSASSSSGFKPSFGSAPTGVFKPAAGSSSGAGSFMSQWKKTAKTYEELAAERKQKVKDEDWDDEDETEEEWSARYDKEEAERLAEEKKQVAQNTATFSVTGSATSSGSTTPTGANPFASLKKPAATSTLSAFSPRAGSPALSTGSQSVLEGASNAASPNIFGHLSSAPPSSHQDESDEDDGHQPVGSVEPSTPPKRKYGESETEDDDSNEDATKSKKLETGVNSKGSLLSRMTRAEPNEINAENKTTDNPVFGQSNGTQTPTNKPFSFFDFDGANSKSSSPKPQSFVGDQTFKPGTPIKFGDFANTEKKTPAPLFQFQPATPAPGEFSTTPAKPPPSTFFNLSQTGGSSLLAPNTGLSSASSMPSSVFSSRAGTPLSEADTNASAAENDDEEGEKPTQVDFSQLTDAEKEANDVIYHHEVVLARQQVDKEWQNLAKGPMWILKDKTTAKCFVRIRLPNGSTPLNYSILPSLRATLSGASKKMVLATKPSSTGGLQSVLFAVKTPELAQELADRYNESLPSN